jgi:hypothetical protein
MMRGLHGFFMLSSIARFLLALLAVALIIVIAGDMSKYWDIVRILGFLGFLAAIPGFYLPPRPVGLTDHLLFLTSSLTGFALSLMAGKPSLAVEILLLILSLYDHYMLARPTPVGPAPPRGRPYWL